MNILMDIMRLKVKMKARYKSMRFMKYASVGQGTTFGQCARCMNQTGKKENLIIGNHCDIDATLSIQGNGKLTVGDYTTIRFNSTVGGVEQITIGSYVIISNHVTIYDNNNHPTDPDIRMKMCKSGFYSDMWNWRYSSHKPVIIEDNVWIGEYATILKGVTIGKGAIVASHSVVTKEVRPYTIVAGNPAREVKQLIPSE